MLRDRSQAVQRSPGVASNGSEGGGVHDLPTITVEDPRNLAVIRGAVRLRSSNIQGQNVRNRTVEASAYRPDIGVVAPSALGRSLPRTPQTRTAVPPSQRGRARGHGSL